MEKLKLGELNLGKNAEVLSREQLKKVLGGAGSGSGTNKPCTFSISCVYEEGYHGDGSGGCSGTADSNGNCFPAEQQCYEQANEHCDSQPHCVACVPY